MFYKSLSVLLMSLVLLLDAHAQVPIYYPNFSWPGPPPAFTAPLQTIPIFPSPIQTAPVVTPQFIPAPYVPEFYPNREKPMVPPSPPAQPVYVPQPPLVGNETESLDRREPLKQDTDVGRQKPQGQNSVLAPRAQRSTVLIFRNGQRQEVQNYGIAGQTLWIFDEEKSTKVSLQEIDINATQRENRARGVRFSPPTQ